MIGQLFEFWFQEYMLETSDGFARWLYGSEAVVVFIVLLLMTANGSGDPLMLFAVWYMSWNITCYFENNRKRKLNEYMREQQRVKGRNWLPDDHWSACDIWHPPNIALAAMAIRKLFAIVIIFSLTLVLTYVAYSLTIRLVILAVGISICAFKGIQFYVVCRHRQWPYD